MLAPAVLLRQAARRALPILMMLSMLAACAAPAASTTTLPAGGAAGTPTPDVYATSAARTLAALAATAAPGGEAIRTRTPAPTASPRPTATPRSAPTLTPTPTVTSSLTSSLTPSLTPGTGGGPILTPGPLTLIRSFEALPPEIDPGSPVFVRWSAVGDQATLWTIDARGTLSEFWDVEVSGSRTFTTSTSLRNTLRYMLVVSQGELTESAMVEVRVRCPAVWFFAPPPALCPQDAAVVSTAALQRFERGLMIWLQALDRIYVLFDDGSYPKAAAVTDVWEPGLPESDPGIVPPAGFYQPVRGFGLLWRGETDALLNARARLGWALEPETGYTASFQCDAPPRYVTCYVSDPAGRTLVLKPEFSGWEVWTGTGGSD